MVHECIVTNIMPHIAYRLPPFSFLHIYVFTQFIFRGKWDRQFVRHTRHTTDCTVHIFGSYVGRDVETSENEMNLNVHKVSLQTTTYFSVRLCAPRACHLFPVLLLVLVVLYINIYCGNVGGVRTFSSFYNVSSRICDCTASSVSFMNDVN